MNIKQKSQLLLQRMLFVILFSLLFLVSSSGIQAQVLLYEEQRGDEVFHYHYSFLETSDTYTIHVARLQGSDTTDKQILVTGPGFQTLSWRYIRFGEETDVLATLTPEGVYIKGVLDGDELDDDKLAAGAQDMRGATLGCDDSTTVASSLFSLLGGRYSSFASGGASTLPLSISAQTSTSCGRRCALNIKA